MDKESNARPLPWNNREIQNFKKEFIFAELEICFKIVSPRNANVFAWRVVYLVDDNSKKIYLK